MENDFSSYDKQGIVPDFIYQMDSFYTIHLHTSSDEAKVSISNAMKNNVPVFVVKTPPFKPGETFLTKNASGEEKSIAEVFPQETKSIQKL